MAFNDFRTLSLSEKLLQAIADQGFTEMTPVQAACIPRLLDGKDIIGQSQTGSGKTAAFIIPIMQKIKPEITQPQALILCPTRELCEQVLQQCRKFARAVAGLQTLALVGGQPYPPQIQALQQGTHLLVGTPGRTLEMMKKAYVDVSQLQILVLDEADRMLDEGFQDEMEAIIQMLPTQRQTAFFSATFPEEITSLSQKYQNQPERISQIEENQNSLQIEQYVYEAENPDKIPTLIRILQRHPSMCTLIFCRTKATVEEVGQMLANFKISSAVLHGDLEQAQRDRVTSLFRNGSLRILVATDVAARGLDIESLELVVNLDLPSSPETYIHRIGRTGRAGRKGVAVSISNAYEIIKVAEIEKATKIKMIRQPLGFKNQLGLGNEFRTTRTKTIVISGGRSHKLRPGDILGALTAEPQALIASEIGKIEIHDRFTYVAIASSLAQKALEKLRMGKIKGTKFKSSLL